MSEVEEEISDAFNDSWPACDGMKFLQICHLIVLYRLTRPTPEQTGPKSM